MIAALASFQQAQSVSYRQPTIAQSSPDPAKPPEYTPAGDTVSISNEARYSLLSTKLSPAPNGKTSFYSINDDFSNATAIAENSLQKLYAQLGIASDSQMDISIGHDGHILVNGESPKADALAEAINADDELSNTLRGMSAMASALEAIKKAEEFNAAYEQDPTAAIKRYGYLLEDGHDYHVSFSMKNGHIDTTVEYI